MRPDGSWQEGLGEASKTKNLYVHISQDSWDARPISETKNNTEENFKRAPNFRITHFYFFRGLGGL